MKQNEKDYDFMLKIKQAYEEQGKNGESSIRNIAIEFGISRTKVRKILVTLGALKNELTEAIKELKKQGLTIEQIADEIGISMATVSTYMPYETVIYNGADKSVNATNIERYRERLKDTLDKQVYRSTNKSKNKTEDAHMRERDIKLYKLHLELNTENADLDILKKYGKVNKGISRDIFVFSDITLHTLHYIIQRLFGWQNSHLHHYELPDRVFNEITDNNLIKWSRYCGTYFRFPMEEKECLYWDDDYDGTVSFKTWLRRKYTTLGGGDCAFVEHFMEAKYQALAFINENKTISIMPSFEEMMNTKDEEYSFREKPIADVTCDEFDRSVEGSSTRELLERLRLSEIFKTDNEPLSLNEVMAERNDLFFANQKEFIRLNKAMQNDDWYEYDRRMKALNGKAKPITSSLLYQYDYGDGWEVNITFEDVYYCDSCWDHPNKDGFVTVAVTKENVYDDITVLDKNGAIIEEELAEKIKGAVSNRRPVCVEADGLPVLDDVGGIGGYCAMLSALHGKVNEAYPFEDADETKQWALGQGWNGRMNKPEKML